MEGGREGGNGEKGRVTIVFERSKSRVSGCAYHSVGEFASRDLGC